MFNIHCSLFLVWCSYLERTVEKDGAYIDVKKGIPMGSSLSLLMGEFYLSELDRKLEGVGLFHVRFMDDILVMASTRWKLREAIWTINRGLEKLGLEKHPDKMYIGKIEMGFDFLGYRFGSRELDLAEKTINNFFRSALRVYEQKPPVSGQRRLEMYTTDWMHWAYGCWVSLHPGSLDVSPTLPSLFNIAGFDVGVKEWRE